MNANKQITAVLLNDRNATRHKRGRGIEMHIDRKIPSLIDGEEYREENVFVVECVRHALQLIVPYEF